MHIHGLHESNSQKNLKIELPVKFLNMGVFILRFPSELQVQADQEIGNFIFCPKKRRLYLHLKRVALGNKYQGREGPGRVIFPDKPDQGQGHAGHVRA